jgi:hypothetical protein
MLNYEQTVINGVPVKGYNFYVLALSDLNSKIYLDLKNSIGSGYSFNINKTLLPGYIWDMYKMVRKLPITNRSLYIDNLFFTRHTLQYDSRFYKKLWITGFSDDPGSSLFSPLTSYYPLALDNKLSFEKQEYRINQMSFYPFVSSTGDNEQSYGQNSIYKASVIPLFPLFFATNNSGHISYGPVFMSDFEIRVNGVDSLSDVEISCSFLGGKTLISPDYFNIEKPVLKGESKIVEFADFEAEEIYDYYNYRTANLSDCLFTLFQPTNKTVLGMKKQLFASMGVSQSKDETVTNYVYTSKTPVKVIGMSLKITQDIALTHTNPVIDDGTSADIIGPKFAALRSRVVTGSISLYNANFNDYLDKYTSSPLVMYFGGNFIYHFKNVDWSNPTFSMTPNGGKVHTWNFTARLPQGAGFWGGSRSAVSEIDVDYRSVLNLL